ncbi:MAG: hypothetical protein HUU01_21535 [Saprospiraceae bacterium]|nr:hypothetical protein [Saprospiraceae bacterium]
MGYFLLFNWLTEAGARVAIYLSSNNLPLLHFYTLGEFVLLSFFYRTLFPQHGFFRKYFVVILTTVSLLIVLNTIFLQSIYAFNSYAKTLVQIILIIYAIVYFFHLPEAPSFQKSESWYRAPLDQMNPGGMSNFRKHEGWSLRLINSAVLIYYCGSLFIFMFSNVFIQKSVIYHSFWIFNALLNFLFQVLVLLGLWRVAFRRPKLSF